jgi:hypothetical protein
VKAQWAIAQFLALIRSVRDRPSSRLPTREAVYEAAKTERRPSPTGLAHGVRSLLPAFRYPSLASTPRLAASSRPERNVWRDQT